MTQEAVEKCTVLEDDKHSQAMGSRRSAPQDAPAGGDFIVVGWPLRTIRLEIRSRRRQQERGRLVCKRLDHLSWVHRQLATPLSGNVMIEIMEVGF